MGKLYAAALILVSIVLQPLAWTASAAEAPAKPAKRAKAKGASGLQGQLQSIDRATMTVTIQQKDKTRVVAISSETRILKNGKPAALTDVAAGDTVSGTIKKGADGKEVAVTLGFGSADAKPAPPAKKAAPAPAK